MRESEEMSTRSIFFSVVSRFCCFRIFSADMNPRATKMGQKQASNEATNYRTKEMNVLVHFVKRILNPPCISLVKKVVICLLLSKRASEEDWH